MPLTNNFTDASTMATDHPAHHNDLANKVNPLMAFPLFRRSGRWYDQSIVSYSTTTGTMTANTQAFFPLIVTNAITIDRVAIEVTSASGTAGATAALGIHVDAGDAIPGNLLTQFGTVPIDSTGVKELTVNQALAAGTLYWVTYNTPGSAGFRQLPTGSTHSIGSSNSTNTVPFVGYSGTTAYTGTLPSTPPTLGGVPNLQIRFLFRIV